MPLISMTAADLTKFIAFGDVLINKMWGWNNQGSDLYIQLHQTIPLAAGGLTASTVPACKSVVAQHGNGFFYSFGVEGMRLTELTIGISSTETNYTAVSANGGLDMTVEVGSNFLATGSETVVGDLTTNQQTLQVWSEATGALSRLRLIRVDVVNNDNTNAGLFKLYATDAMAGSDLVVALAPVTKVGSGSVTNPYRWGVEGISPFQQDKNYTQHFGCSITVTGSTNSNIRAMYR